MNLSYVEPALPLLLLLAVIGLIRAWRDSRPDRRPWLMTLGIAGLVLLSWDPAVWLFSRPLEIWYEKRAFPSAPADAIVVLAGSVDSPRRSRPYPLAAKDTYSNFQHAAWLFKHWAPRPVLACGGGGDSESYSQTMRHLLESEGVPADMIWIEDRSRNTHENALLGYGVLKQRGISRIALVTDARSMVRAAASFRKQGLTVVPAPVQFYDFPEPKDLLPNWQAIQSNGETAHELLALGWYWLRSWI
jgi:uncharacterized SAM-binding protein YcdF (DUF218 family)